ncbi:GNAT family N-acetyltransferase [Massilia sp. W12]|uniref:GNAT family N-acetyltransferase n=1 Tax=Massilia sp. W12 TaxID=3126507 RepID=UPI0030CBBD7C
MSTQDLAAIRWEWLAFDQFSPHSLYHTLALRSQVFVVEQACPYLDPDGLDLQAMHLLAWDERAQPQLAACLRVLPAGVKYPEAAIGRVVCAPAWRGCGLGRALMQEALTRLSPGGRSPALRLAAQHYLQAFYAGFGFAPCSGVYDEDGIAHVDMLRPAR